MVVHKLSATLLVNDEDIVDYGLGTPEAIEAASRRIEERRAESVRRWEALPWRVRVYRRLLMRWHMWKYR